VFTGVIELAAANSSAAPTSSCAALLHTTRLLVIVGCLAWINEYLEVIVICSEPRRASAVVGVCCITHDSRKMT